MNSIQTVPFIPENAPFTAEQRAYLNGYFAGLYARVPVATNGVAAATRPARSLSILFGSQTGNCETLARRLAKEASKHGFTPTVRDLAQVQLAELGQVRDLLVITSTYGDGEPPDNALGFWEALSREDAPRFENLSYSVCALGDSNYTQFCRFGVDVDLRLEALGARRVCRRVDCDVDYEEAFSRWLAEVVGCFNGPGGNAGESVAPAAVVSETRADAEPAHGRNQPFPAPLQANLKLNGQGSAKDVRHFEFGLNGSGLEYEVGDALGVMPRNCPELVEELLGALGFSGEEDVPGRDGNPLAVRAAWLTDYDITKPPPALIRAVAERAPESHLRDLLKPESAADLKKYLWGRELIDLVLENQSARFTAREFTELLRKMQPRLYSISSSPKAHPGEVHLSVGVVTYEAHGRLRKGVCSTFLAERLPTREAAPVFVQKNSGFRPPTDSGAPCIMVGPGTGIAPFRAFLEDRQATGASGRNWLFFGDQKSSTDFLYKERLMNWYESGLLTRLDLAWSRDQSAKVYVQNKMLENAPELWQWLEDGAGFYVCGDANRMARDVDVALHQVVQAGGGRTVAQAEQYVRDLKAQKRYCRDVY
ncbi:MAG: sulfite reductase subunit alpha [Verrucomicrobia bacterium]|nr:sulfite reductase subunit alpha [Verrucomicrobiota bacterium]